MRVSRWLPTVLLLAGSVTTSADLPAPPDRSPHRFVPATIDLDWGPFADRVSRRHVVARGETLTARVLTLTEAISRYDATGALVTKIMEAPPPDHSNPPSPGLLPAKGPSMDANPRADPPAMDAEAETTDDGARWPVTTGLLVAGGGLVIVAAAWAARRRRAAAAP